MATDYLKLAEELESGSPYDCRVHPDEAHVLMTRAAQAIRGLVEERDRIFGEFTNSMSKRGGLVISLCKANKQIATLTARNERLEGLLNASKPMVKWFDDLGLYTEPDGVLAPPLTNFKKAYEKATLKDEESK